MQFCYYVLELTVNRNCVCDSCDISVFHLINEDSDSDANKRYQMWKPAGHCMSVVNTREQLPCENTDCKRMD